MDIAALRLGFAHHALRRALGEELSPISFAQGSFAFLDRSSGARFFCSADSSLLSILPLREDGALAGAEDAAAHAAAAALRARAEPEYLSSWGSFARDFDNANSTEARLAARLAAGEPEAPAATSADAPARPASRRRPAAEALASAAAEAPAPSPARAPTAPAPVRRAPAPRPAPVGAESGGPPLRAIPMPAPAAPQALRFTRAPRKMPAR